MHILLEKGAYNSSKLIKVSEKHIFYTKFLWFLFTQLIHVQVFNDDISFYSPSRLSFVLFLLIKEQREDFSQGPLRFYSKKCFFMFRGMRVTSGKVTILKDTGNLIGQTPLLLGL
jgi:hypothetical protein